MGKRKSVIIKERAFWSMILSAIEVFHLETLGLLLGMRGEDKFIVEYAIPYQSAQKQKTWVSPNERRASRVRKIIDILPIDVIGDFHSHTEIGETKATVVPSGDDIADMEEEQVYVILALNESEKTVKWHQNQDGSISGTLGGYHIRMIAHELDKRGRRYKNVEIVCPAAVGLKDDTEGQS
jgi:hypothetical protein